MKLPCIFHRWRLVEVGKAMDVPAGFAWAFGNCLATYRCDRCGKTKQKPMVRPA